MSGNCWGYLDFKKGNKGNNWAWRKNGSKEPNQVAIPNSSVKGLEK
jgi:hypothetical protein